MKQNNLLLKNKIPLLSFGIALLMMFFFYIANGIMPFGNQTILASDAFHQYAPFLAELCDKIKNGESLLYSLSNGLGSSFIANFFNYMSSPLNFIILLFGKENIQASIAIIIAIKTSLSAFTFSFVAEKILKNKNSTNIIFGLSYAFSAFFISFYWNIMWYDAVYMLPILAYGVYKLVIQRKCGLFIFALSYTMITNYYMGYMLCIASVILFLYFSSLSINNIKQKETIIKKDKTKERNILLHRCCIFGISAICSALVACVALLPIYNALQWSSATNDSMGSLSLDILPMQFISSHFALTSTSFRTGNYFGTAMPNIYCGILSLLLIPLFFLNKKINKKEKIITSILIAVFYLSFSVNALNYVWHAFHYPNDLPYRFAYIWVFFMVFIAIKTFNNIDGLTKKQIMITTIISSIVVLVFGLFFAPNSTVLTVPFTIILMLIYMTFLFKYLPQKENTGNKKKLNKMVSKTTLCVLLCLVIICEIALPYMNSFVTYKGELLLRYQDEIENAQSLINRDDFYRMELLKNQTLNDSALYNYNGISSFSSMNYSYTSLLQKYYGISSNGLNSNGYKSATPLYNMIMGLDYIINNDDNFTVNENYFKEIGKTQSGYSIYENKFKTGIGFASITNLSEPKSFDYQTYSPFTNHSNTIEAISGVSDLITHTNSFTFKENGLLLKYNSTDNPNNKIEYTITGERNESNAIITTTINETGNYYAYVVSTEFDVVFNLPEKEKVLQSSMTNYLYAIDLGILKSGETFDAEIYVNSKTKESGSFNYFVCKVNDNKLNQAYDVIKENGIMTVTDYSDNSFTATIDSKTNFIYTNIPFDTNWVITIDGKPANDKVEIVANALIGLNIEAGSHTISFEYKQPMVTIGLVTSVSTIFMLAIVYFLRKKK